MKKAFVILVFIVGICAAYLFHLRRELGLYWQQWFSVQRHFVCRDRHPELRQPFLSDSVAKQDPEAAALVNFIYQDYIGDDSREVLWDIELLSDLSLRYPDNPYFLYELGCRMATKIYVDPEILITIADRLLEMDPNNGRYYFLKAFAAFYDWDENRAEQALDYLERCFASPNQFDPYDLYKSRAVELFEQEKPAVFIPDGTYFHPSSDSWLLRNLSRDMLAYTQDLIINGESDRAMRIHDRLQRLAENSIPRQIEFPWQTFWVSFDPGAHFPKDIPQTTELKWMNLDSARARQDRLQMLAWMKISETARVKQQSQQMNPKPTGDHWSIYWIPPAAYSFQMTLACLAGFVIFLGIGLAWKMQKSRISGWSFFGATLFFLLYFAACRTGDYQQMHLCCGCHYTFDCVPSSIMVSGLLCLSKPLGLYGMAITTMILGIPALIYLKKRKKPGLFVRILLRLAGILFVLSLWLTVSRLQFDTPIFDLLALLVSIPLFCFPLRNLKTKAYLSLFSGSAAGKEYRARCLILCGYAAVLHLIIFTVSAPALGEYTVAHFRHWKQERIWEPVTPARYAIDPNSYPQLLAQFKTKTLGWSGLQHWLPMVEPEDIPAVLTSLKKRRESDPNCLSIFGRPITDPHKAGTIMGFAPPDDYLYDLPRAMELCGKDAFPYILPFLKDPNRVEELLLRDRTDDPAVRRRLVEIWQKTRETKRMPDQELMKCFTREQKGELIDQFLPSMKEKPYWYSLLEILQYDSTMSLSSREWLWKQIIDYSNKEDKLSYLDDLNLFSKPADYHISDVLLEECLSSQNERLRAMGQHIYRKLGKPADEKLFRQWAADPSSVIRANTAVLAPELLSSKDPSPYVRLIQKLSK